MAHIMVGLHPTIPGIPIGTIPGTTPIGPGTPTIIGAGAGVTQTGIIQGGMALVCGAGTIGDIVPGLTGLMAAGPAGIL